MTGLRRPWPAVAAAAATCVLMLPTGAAATGEASTSPVAFRQQKVITRVNATTDTRNFSLSVSQTANLKGNQEIDVSWTGAHPTAGIFPDPNADTAMNEEYPVVLLECRGQDSTAVPAARQLSPTSCWTAASDERYQESFNTLFPPWRLDRYASAAQTAAVVALPPALPTGCNDRAPAQYWVPFVAGSGATFDAGPNGCGGLAPEASNVGGLNLPSNETFAVTGNDGTGSARFDAWTDEENASLGCSDTVPCALVAVPIMGISCQTAPGGSAPSGSSAAAPAGASAPQPADYQLCQKSGAYAAGQLAPSLDNPDLAVTGALWWAASNWRNRVTVPLSFAPPSNICDVVGKTGGVDLYGSGLMTQAFLQWSPHFCLDPSLFNLKLVQTPEPEARSLLGTTGGVEAAVGSQAPAGGFPAPAVNAPIAVTGFAITFDIDDAGGQPVSTLRLTPRLLAKLLAESYPATPLVQHSDPPLANNPLDVSVDPEFVALNPGLSGPGGTDATESAATLLALSSQSDVMYALTSYINNDPDARAWLNGTPDPWGMVVNPAYKGIALPTATWPLLDTYVAPFNATQNDCLANAPVPYLPLVASPQSTLAKITQAMQFALAPSETICVEPNDTSVGEKLAALGRQTPGARFMIGVSSVADADRYQLATASLLTKVAPGSPAKLTSAAGRTFVAADDASLEAAAKLLAPDPATESWPIPYQAISSADAAYPGTMVVYAQVPTTGLSATDAADYAKFLQFAATDGQVPGTGNGQLPPGYIPMTAANGLGPLASYTEAAALAVGAQKGVVPSVVPAPGSAPPTSSTPAVPSSSPTPQRPAASFSAPRRSLSMTPASPSSPAPPSLASVDGILGFVGNTISQVSGWAGAILPLLLVVAAFGAVGAFLSYLIGHRRRG